MKYSLKCLPKACLTLVGAAVLSSLMFSGSASAQQEAEQPEADQAWLTCILSEDTVAAIQTDLEEQPKIQGNQFDDLNAGKAKVSYIAIFVHDHPNFGQELVDSNGATTGYTGIAICRNDAAVGAPVASTEAAEIPAQGNGTVDILDAEDAFLIRYDENGDILNRICLTTDGRTDCAIISP